jgi:hypothetical protein
LFKGQSNIIYCNILLSIFKIEKEITNGNKTNEKALAKISEIIRLMDQGEKDDSKNKDRMMELIYEVLRNVLS